MKHFYSLTIIAAALAGAILLPSYSSGPSQAGSGNTGAPSEGTCVSCHSSNALNSGNGSFSISIQGSPTTYTPGQTYTITITGAGSSVNRYGFQMVALKTSDNSNAGTFTAGTGTKAVTLGSRGYIEHSTPSSSGTWSFTWKAPASDVGDVIFYLAGNAAENPASIVGDNIYTKTFTFKSTPNSIDKPLKSKVSIYPNPASDVVQITGLNEIEMVEIMDGKGAIVAQFTNVQQNQINVSSLAKGVYSVRVKTAADVKYSKLVKK